MSDELKEKLKEYITKEFELGADPKMVECMATINSRAQAIIKDNTTAVMKRLDELRVNLGIMAEAELKGYFKKEKNMTWDEALDKWTLFIGNALMGIERRSALEPCLHVYFEMLDLYFENSAQMTYDSNGVLDSDSKKAASRILKDQITNFLKNVEKISKKYKLEAMISMHSIPKKDKDLRGAIDEAISELKKRNEDAEKSNGSNDNNCE